MKKDLNKKKRFLKSAVMALIIMFTVTAVFTPVEVNAAAKKAKASYSVKVTNINSNTVLKKGTKIKVQYVATKKKGGVVSGAKVKFKSSNKKVASISKKGVIKAKKKGTTYITVYCKAKPSKKKKVKVRVGTPVSSISVSGFTYLGKGHSNTLKAKVNSGATNKSVSWNSDNTSVATVNSSGKVSAKGYGSATIYARAKDGSGVVGSRTIHVHKYMRDETIWIAHRGLHTSARENTAAAFNAAGAARFQAAECDIWETAKETPNVTLPDRYTADSSEEGGEEGGESQEDPELPENLDVPALLATIKSLPGASASYDEVIDSKSDIYDAWKEYTGLTNDWSDLQKSLVREKLIEDSGEDLLQTLFNHYTKVYGYDSMDLAINHDATFSGGGTVKNMTKTQINSKVSFKVCYLGEYLDICKDSGMIPVIEFKDSSMSPEAVRKAIEMIKERDMLESAYMISFHENILQQAKQMAEKRLDGKKPITYHLFSSNGSKEVKIARDRGFTGISVRKDVLTDSIYNEAKSYGLGVGTWTYKNDASSDEYLGKHLLSGRYKLDFVTVDYKTFKD